MKIEQFKNVLAASPLIGNRAAFVAWSIVVLEWVAVLLLLYPAIRLAGHFLCLLLMTVFTGYISIMLLSSSHLPCSCGGILKALNWSQHLYLNIGLTILALGGFLVQKKKHHDYSVAKYYYKTFIAIDQA